MSGLSSEQVDEGRWSPTKILEGKKSEMRRKAAVLADLATGLEKRYSGICYEYLPLMREGPRKNELDRKRPVIWCLGRAEGSIGETLGRGVPFSTAPQ